MQYIFISPHLDDVALSCGGIIQTLCSNGHEVSIWTVFAGIPENIIYTDFAESLHLRWKLTNKNPILSRQKEDQKACQILGTNCKYFHFLDCIYRENEKGSPIIQKESDLFQNISGNQTNLVDEIANAINKQLPSTSIIVSPFAIGNHIDHQLVKSALLKINIQLWFYADYPYVTKENSDFDETYIDNLEEEAFLLSEKSILMWKQSVSAYLSQISTFWNGTNEMFTKVDEYVQKGGGKKLWKMPANQ